MARRANNEGSIYQCASDGRWCGSLKLPNGKRKVIYGKTQREALTKLRALQRHLDEGWVVSSGPNLTVGAYLKHWAQEGLEARLRAGRLAPSTVSSYRDQVRLHLVPDLGQLPLTKLSAPHLRTWLSGKQQLAGPAGKPLSSRSIAYQHAVLRAALSDAVRDELVTRNVATLVEPPRGSRKTAAALTPEEVGRLLAAAEGSRLRPLWLVLLGLGLRRGEALALRWEDLDLEAGTVRVHRSLQRVRDGEPDSLTGRRKGRLVESQSTKTGQDTVLPLPGMVSAELENHRRAHLKERLAAPSWVDPGLVFTTGVGTALEPRNVNRAWAALCDKAKVRSVRVHDLRHTAASLLLAQGVDMKVVQTTLRHTRLSTTADVYTHVQQELQRSAADRMDDLLRGLAKGS